MKVPSKAFVLVLFIIPALVVTGQKKESVLWEITGKNLPGKSYVFGTVHSVSHKLLDSFPAIKKIISLCAFGLFEKGENTIGDVKDTTIYIPPLDAVFSESEYAIVDSFFANSPFGSIKAHNNDASLQGMLQGVIMLKQKETGKQEMFFDEYIQVYMDSLGKGTFQLDEPVEMAKAAAKENHKRIAELIVNLINHEFSYNDILPKSIFDIELYTASLLNDMKLNQEITERMMIDGTVERNLIWMPKMNAKLKEGSCFIAVGLGHLQYKTGLIQLLRKEGYTLKSVKLKKYS